MAEDGFPPEKMKPSRCGPAAIVACLLLSLACGTQTLTAATETPEPDPKTRLESIPPGNPKGSPETDPWPPEAVSGWSKPVPLEGPVNTAGGEDSPFVTPDGNTLYFTFISDVNLPAEKQLIDGVTGIWVSRRAGESWSEPVRVVLTNPGTDSLDGCIFVRGDRMYFCSVRAGNWREIDWYYATFSTSIWTGVTHAGTWMNETYEVGELHITNGYREIYFASRMAGGSGGFDLWKADATPDGWGEPVNLGPEVNTNGDENQPFVTEDGSELWFSSTSRRGKPGPAVFQCLRREDSSWGDCREIFSSFAGEPTLTGDGRTAYFVHHFFTTDGQMIEADIYVTHRQE
jgi:hypothetical protein